MGQERLWGCVRPDDRTAPDRWNGPGQLFLPRPDYSTIGGSDPLPPDNAQNWYRHQLAEFGVLGSIGWIAWVAAFGWFVVTARAGRAVDRPTAGILRGSLVALAIISLVGMPAWNPAVTLMFWTMAFWLTAVASPGTAEPQKKDGVISAAQSIGIGVVLLACLAGKRRTLRGTIYGSRIERRSTDGAIPTASTSRSERRTARSINGPAACRDRPAGAKAWLRLTVGVNHADIARKPVDVKVWTDLERVLTATLRTTEPVTEFVRLPAGASRVVLETWVSRAPSADFGRDDPRTLGLMVAWDFVDAPSRVAAP